MDLTPITGALRAHADLLLLLNRMGGLVLTLFAGYLVLRVLRAALVRVASRMKSRLPKGPASDAEEHNRIETLLRVGFDVLKVLVYVFVGLTILGQLGVSVQPLVAGAGLLGAAVALGSQTVVKDFLSGFFILLEGHFVIGDSVVLPGGLAGTVEKMTLRVTILRDADGAVHIVPNGAIATVTNKTYHWSQGLLTLGVPTTADPSAVRASLEKAALAVAARDPGGESLLDAVLVSGPNNVRGTTVEWSLSARARAGQASRVKSWLVEDALRELQSAAIPLAA